jgi:hypothetical protein
VEVENLVRRGSWSARVHALAQMRFRNGSLELDTRLEAFESERLFARRTFHTLVGSSDRSST